MPRSIQAWGLLVCLLLSACGGGSGESEAPSAPLRGQPRASVAFPMAPDAGTLMDWAESRYPTFFPGPQSNASLSPYLYRYYPATGNYLGVAGNEVFVHGPVSNGTILPVGRLADFACQVYPSSCQGAADSRNGSYIAYSAAGERFTLHVDFDSGAYSITGISFPGYQAAGSFTADSTAGTYLFHSSGVANARFRHVDDLIVGSFDTGSGNKPFVAAKYFAQSFAEAAGAYNIFYVNRSTAGVVDSFIYQGRLGADGTLRLCFDNQIYTIDQCPAASVGTYAVTLNGDQFTATASNGSYFYLRVAKAGGRQIYLTAGISLSTGTRGFGLGLPESASFSTMATYGANTAGSWVSETVTTSRYVSAGSDGNGQAVSLNGNLYSIAGPSGFRIMYGTGFVMQNPQLTALVGARGGAYAGFLQLGAR